MSVRSGEPLLAVAIAGADAAHFSQRLRAGSRAITIAVDEVNALSGMLQPGDRIVSIDGKAVVSGRSEQTPPSLFKVELTAGCPCHSGANTFTCD